MTSRTLRGLYLVGELLEESASQVMLKTQTRVCVTELQLQKFVASLHSPRRPKRLLAQRKFFRVLETDFVETSPKYKPYFMEDERFLRILEDGVKKQSDGRYVMPLPLKSDSVSSQQPPTYCKEAEPTKCQIREESEDLCRLPDLDEGPNFTVCRRNSSTWS